MRVVSAVLLCQLVVVSVAAVDQLQFVEEWQLWKTEHGKSYSGGREERERHAVWLENREFVLSHNADWQEHGYSLALNQFADLVCPTIAGTTEIAYYIYLLLKIQVI